MAKKCFSIKLNPEMMKNVSEHGKKMGREKQDIIREAMSIGLPIMEMPEYYMARLNGISIKKITQEVKAVLKSAASAPR